MISDLKADVSLLLYSIVSIYIFRNGTIFLQKTYLKVYQIVSCTMRGFSLLEVLISMLLLSFVLIGLDAMEILSVKISRNNYYFSVAADQLQVMEEKMLLLHSSVAVAQQMDTWNRENSELLPHGRGEWHRSRLTIYWGDTTQRDCLAPDKGFSECLSKEIALPE